MKVLFALAMAFFSASSLAQTSNDKLIKTCVNSGAAIEIFVYQRLDFIGRPIQSQAKERDLYRVDIYENNISVYKTDYALFSKQNSEFYSARGMALSLNYANSGKLYLSNINRYGRRNGPLFNSLKVNCKNYPKDSFSNFR